MITMTLLILNLLFSWTGYPLKSSEIMAIPPFDDCKQLVIVVGENEESTTGSLRRFERRKNEWKQIGEPHAVNLGRTGLAWGKGLHMKRPGYQKQEGDGKSPAGIFRFGDAFGYAPAEEVSFKMKYLPVSEMQICVEDSTSRYYNQIVDETAVQKDWESRESMLRKDEQYKWGIFVKHNLPAEPGSGSCIFFHLWRAPGSPTLGCTAMTEENLLALMRWLDPMKKPLLVQVTQDDYQDFQEKFGLPVLNN
jgi:D-alanyl-D-alanine dipeptidase